MPRALALRLHSLHFSSMLLLVLTRPPLPLCTGMRRMCLEVLVVMHRITCIGQRLGYTRINPQILTQIIMLT